MRLPDMDGNSAIRALHQYVSRNGIPDPHRIVQLQLARRLAIAWDLTMDRVYQKPLNDMAPLAAAARTLAAARETRP
jgi:CheY-like chemotaxis protein